MGTVGVVPIFINAGAAIAPAVAGALASVLAILLKPREILRICRARPRTVSIVILAVSLLTFAIVRGTGVSSRSDSRKPTQPHTRFDWAKVAEDILAQERAGKVASIPGAVVVIPQTPSTPAATTASSVADAISLPIFENRDAARTSYGGGASPAALTRVWAFRPEDSMFLSQPAVFGSRIYAAACQADLGGYTGLLACLDASSGKPIWQITQIGEEFLPPFFSSPAITADGKSLLIGQGLHQDRDCSLLCFDTSNGKLRWKVKTPLHVESSPVIHGDMAVVGAGAIESKDGKPTGDPGFVLAVRISDGKELWRQAVNDPESSPVVDVDGMVYIGSGFNGQAVLALRSESDESLKAKGLERIAWRAPLACPVTSAIAISGDYIIAGAGNGDVVHSNDNPMGLVVALDRKTGKQRWLAQFDDAVLGGVAIRDGKLMVPIRTGQVACVSLDKGEILWKTSISGKAPVLASCAFTPQRVYAVSSDGYLAVLNPTDGKLVEKIYLNDQGKPGTGLSMSPPQVIDGRVIVGSETGGLQCLIASDGAE